MTGLEELNKKLSDLQSNANSISGQNSVPLNELFTRKFMESNTKGFTDISSFFDASPFVLEKQEDLNSIPADELDIYVSKNTLFNSWKEMLSKAGSEWTVKQLGL
ncbi:hypothetical protein DP120_09475 [Planococcus halotolerans]|uniref:Uncharacterized protein n=1 Tax=Planococcus halotolerans TaxID=2233542 RepID=A0A365KXU7_9BACL|nr:hypothetical protein DNR44_017435 [Planococcus halotolerans]RAZ77964.1 hypothetical protein DP120_09475 [Planococcus halotolerans]